MGFLYPSAESTQQQQYPILKQFLEDDIWDTVAPTITSKIQRSVTFSDDKTPTTPEKQTKFSDTTLHQYINERDVYVLRIFFEYHSFFVNLLYPLGKQVLPY